MSSLKLNIFFATVVLCTLVQAKFPTDPKPCKYGDVDCIMKISNYFIKEKAKEGDSSINLAKLEPLHVEKIEINQGEESPVNINLKFTNNEIIGMSNIIFYKVKGFEKDLQKKQEMRFKTNFLSLISDYSIKGKVLVLPISGKGKSNMTLIDTDVAMTFMTKLVEKDGGSYLKAYDLKLIANPSRLYYNFSNLFNGDKALGDSMNAFLNENWKEIYGEVQVSIQNAFAQIFEAIINNIFTKYPYEKFFEE